MKAKMHEAQESRNSALEKNVTESPHDPGDLLSRVTEAE
jgi:hypothetical protein